MTRMRRRREPRDIEQCIGCGTAVPIYSSRQLVDGEVYCPGCRRIMREDKAKERKKRGGGLRLVEAAPLSQRCEHEWVDTPSGKVACRICLAYPEEVENPGVMRRRNPLDPYAYDTEDYPFVTKQRAPVREEQLGVHTTPELPVAILYAVQRASFDITPLDPDDEPNCGVVFSLDTTGLEPLPDVDAAIAASQNRVALDEMLDDPGISQALYAGNAEELAEYVDEYVDIYGDAYDDTGWPPDTYLEAAWREIEDRHARGLLYLLRDLVPEDLLRDLEYAREHDNVPMELWMEVVQQRRYMSVIGLDRLQAVHLVRPVRWKLWGNEADDEVQGFDESPDYAPENPDEPQIFAYPEDFLAGDIAEPDMVEVFSQPTRGHVIEFHGTDLTRALSAFPELADVLRSPWPYTQP